MSKDDGSTGHEAAVEGQARWHYAEHAGRAPSPQEALESTEDTVRNRDGVIIRIEEVPSDAGESPRATEEPPGQDPAQLESEEPPAEDGPSATDEQVPDPLTDIQHGGQYWAVLWVGEYGDPELNRVREAIDQRWGPVWSDGDLGCDRGAAEALDADPSARRVRSTSPPRRTRASSQSGQRCRRNLPDTPR